MEFTLAQVVAATGAEFIGAPSFLAQAVHGWSIDSRAMSSGDLFFAIKGEFHDGHRFVADVLAGGAVAAVVSEDVDAQPALRVPDTQRALQQLAHFARLQWGGRVGGVTGSAGKTSTKDIIAEFLKVRLRTGKTIGNLNNHLGLPLSILRLPPDAEIAVLEMGMNHAGEIRELARIAAPEIGVVTNVGYAHVEAFGTIEGVAAAKRELVEALPPDGIAVLNTDDEHVRAFASACRGRSITYGLSDSADFQATDLSLSGETSRFRVRGVEFETHLIGLHSVRNILAGLAAASACGIAPEELTTAVAGLRPAAMRGERFHLDSMTILNDSYNSNPEAARGMVDVLRSETARRRIAVLGEMLELGSMAEQLHRELGEYVARAKINVLVGISGKSATMVKRAVECGLDTGAAFFFDDPEQAGHFLRRFVQSGDAILFKGSRGTHVEKALAKLEP